MAENTKTTLPKEIFAVDVTNHELLKVAYDTYLANSRSAAAKTKKRGEVSGGGKKPWKQKGTGRARFGSSRNPIWRGGGIAFGPTGDQNYTKKLPVGAKRVALRQALSLANVAKKIVIIDDFAPNGKTKDTIKLLSDNKINNEARVLLVVDAKNDAIRRSTNNLNQIKVVSAMYLNVFDILNADNILIGRKALAVVAEWLKKEDK
ncbi:50S ribosomal protein L4 [Candidatus Saccharibacteria bacterium]|nr:50S ribosomal protein L4 [Candidatus Saccharibacteria bacterium]NCU40864.1 50S ribosomal protein L4 [Candidatus Saccharibacteria bacterium]